MAQNQIVNKFKDNSKGFVFENSMIEEKKPKRITPRFLKKLLRSDFKLYY